ncbi:uncharacterized protein K452DRAFT_314186 [Aplosporella prunicola CBS 121167]|uniref:Uncharacterized protein n=1 Tax=Aplosporella prunicola CBS 121167 TaxID=1176127 RepID=A0A6A6AX99_9PEZI|nr:uncharacterized protein K452DRAFT_314186 [Aplosporella prunicola CBS 121167]KAF2135181.1 hypothetical protein K452DRAFT_314186 [Aplosporella prunicola CBS 121167]
MKHGIPADLGGAFAQRGKHTGEAVALLQNLCDTLQSEVIPLPFNYVTLLRTSCLLTTKVSKECDELLREVFPEYAAGEKRMLERDLMHSPAVHLILVALDNGNGKNTEKSIVSLLKKAADVSDGIVGGPLGGLVTTVLEQDHDMSFVDSVNYYDDGHSQTSKQTKG